MTIFLNLRPSSYPRAKSANKRPKRFRPTLEWLEDRTVPANFLVNTTIDTIDINPGDGLAIDSAGNTSLRAAIMEANALTGADTIQLPVGTFALTLVGSGEALAATGDLDITDDLTIRGAVTGASIISAGSSTGLNDRVFDLPRGVAVDNRRVVNFENLQITGGIAQGTGSTSTLEDRGGAIRIDFFNTVNITNVLFSNNTAPRTGTNLVFGLGGAIDNNGFLTIDNSRFENNFASNGGGALYAGGSPAQVTIRNSTFTDNRARGGGAIENHEPMTIDNSTFARNEGRVGTSSGQGGAIDNNGGGNLTLTNCTFSDNISVFGGAISNFETLTVRASTIAGNDASRGGGIYSSSLGTVSIENSIVALNTHVNGGPDIDGVVSSQGHNLIGNTADASGLVASDLLNVDPQLGALANNGGPTQTRALLTGSPAINAANTATAPASDQRGVSRPQGPAADIGAFELQLAPSNQPPVAQDQSKSTNEDTPLNDTLPASDPDEDALSYTVVASPAHGTVQVNAATGAYTYTPDLNYNGPDSFTFKANDGQADSNVATVSITINAVNDPPVAVNDAYTATEDIILQIQPPGVLVNDTDVEGQALTAVLVTQPANGAVVMNANGSFSYRPRFDFNGTDTFTYRARDSSGAESNIATVTITVNAVNDAPRPTPIITRVTTDEDEAIGGQLTAIDPEGDSFTFTSPPEFAPEHGSVIVSATGVWTYTPNADYYAPDIFGYRVTDVHGASSVGAVEITVNPVNDGPVAVTDAYSVDEDGSLVIGVSPASRLHMFSDPGDFIGQGLIWDFTPATAAFSARTNFDNGVEVLVDPPGAVERWTLNFAAPGSVPLTPGVYLNATRWPFQEDNEPGLDVSGYGRGLNRLLGQFTIYDVAYGSGTTVTRFAASFVQQDHNFDDTLEPPLHGTIVFNSTYGAGGGVLANDTDVEGDILPAAVLVSGPTHGSLTFNGDGSFTYTPNANYNGPDSFNYKTTDGIAESNTATVNITVNAVNDAPVANPDSFSIDEDNTLTVAAPGVLGNDADVDSATLTAVLVSTTSNGALTFNSDGSFSYTPGFNFNGTDSFTYKANDGALDSNTTTVTIQVNAVNDAPVASPDSYSIDEDNTLTVAAPGVLGNDADVDSATLSAVLVTSTGNGVLALASDGSFSYTPNANFNGTDSFTYKANDGALDSNTTTVTIQVNAANDAPVAQDQTQITNEDTTLTDTLPATDVDGDALTYAIVAGPAHGIVTLNATTGAYSYAPAANYHGPDSFTFKANDGQVDSNVATVSITVNSVNDAPVATNNDFSTDEDSPLNVATPGVLGNDTDVDGDTLSAVLVSGPSHGALTLNLDGSFTYAPHANYFGSDSFAYKANDGALESNTATVNITVNSVNDAPVAANDSYSTTQGVTLSVPSAGVLANDTDVEASALAAVLVSGPQHGTLTLNADGSFSYVPGSGFNGTDNFTYRANDGLALSNVATATILVAPVTSVAGKITGAGSLDDGLRRFDIHVESKERRGQFEIQGVVEYWDHQHGIHLESTSIASLSISENGRIGIITGAARVNGRSGYTFTVIVGDNGEGSRSKDTFQILIIGPDDFQYDSIDWASAAGLLEGGNIQIHKRR
ncbi:MAG: Ig-like domain-containing protein [Gemmataceae bacterium]|nr:Ig-like domain-containing protein [Gemmataceae bacterium]